MLLVIVDVTGGNGKLVGEKKDKLAEWIKKEQPKFTTTLQSEHPRVCKISLHSAVLAPFATWSQQDTWSCTCLGCTEVPGWVGSVIDIAQSGVPVAHMGAILV